MNGTSKKDLLEALEAAYLAIGEATKALAQTSPNGRDYYPQSPNAINKAQDEHFDRMARLISVQKELAEIAEGMQ
jgi:hypothetical protein